MPQNYFFPVWQLVWLDAASLFLFITRTQFSPRFVRRFRAFASFIDRYLTFGGACPRLWNSQLPWDVFLNWTACWLDFVGNISKLSDVGVELVESHSRRLVWGQKKVFLRPTDKSTFFSSHLEACCLRLECHWSFTWTLVYKKHHDEKRLL